MPKNTGYIIYSVETLIQIYLGSLFSQLSCSCITLFMLPRDGQTPHSAFRKLKIHLFSITSVNCTTSY